MKDCIGDDHRNTGGTKLADAARTERARCGKPRSRPRRLGAPVHDGSSAVAVLPAPRGFAAGRGIALLRYEEEASYSADRITSLAWQDDPQVPGESGYAVLNFDEVPDTEIVLIDRPNEPRLGAGEPAIGCLPGASGNAICNATAHACAACR